MNNEFVHDFAGFLVIVAILYIFVKHLIGNVKVLKSKVAQTPNFGTKKISLSILLGLAIAIIVIYILNYFGIIFIAI